MINPHWSVVDLDPRTWRNIGHFFAPGQYIRSAQPGEHGLFVLHDDGVLLRVVDTVQGVRRDLSIHHIDDPQALALSLYEQGTWQRVHVINKRHLAQVAWRAQNVSTSTIHLDTYYRLVYHLLWMKDDGYVSIPPHPGHWHGWNYQDIQSFVKRLPTAATLALGVFEDAALVIGLILEFHQGMIKKVTTFEALAEPANVADISYDAVEHLWRQLDERFAPPVGVLLCTQEVFDLWINTEKDKYRLLQDAQERGEALWKLEI
jgi:hypothetical protein